MPGASPVNKSAPVVLQHAGARQSERIGFLMSAQSLPLESSPSIAATVRLFLHRFGGDVRRAYRAAERALIAADADECGRWALVCEALARKAVAR